MTSGFIFFLGKSHRSIVSALNRKNCALFCRIIIYGSGYYRREKPVTVYLCFPEKDLLSKAPVIRLVLESILSEMIDTFDTTKGRNCRPTLQFSMKQER